MRRTFTRRGILVAAAAVLTSAAATLLPATAASAHVVPSTTIALDVHKSDITATLTLPVQDLETASGLTLPTPGTPSKTVTTQLQHYFADHLHAATGDDQWTSVVDEFTVAPTEQWGTGAFPAVTATARLTPADVDDLRTFTLNYDAIIHKVVTADIFVTLHSDWAAGELESARSLGAIQIDTVTGTVPPLRVNLAEGSAWQGFVGMLRLGISHIAEGTDHQLFLLTLLLPAPLLAGGIGRRRRWTEPATPRSAIRRITAITIAFTIGHSVTLALGTLGLPVPQQPVEAAIAASIIVAAAHALRPLFPGKEAVIAGIFGLVHGMAFSTTLSALDLSGGQLALSLLGFNLGIEIMQLVVVTLVLPPLVVLARTVVYRPLRTAAASATGLAAVGWLLDRVGYANPVGVAADSIGPASIWIVLALWVSAAAFLIRRRAGTTGPLSQVS